MGISSSARSLNGAGRPKRCTGTTAFVLRVILAATSSGSSTSVCGSISAKTGVAPVRAIASAVAKKVKAGQTTSSPEPTPSASSAMTIASVPLATLTASGTPRYAAASCSKASTLGPSTKRLDTSTSSMTRRNSGSSASYWAFVSASGIGGPGTASKSSHAPSVHEIAQADDDERHDGVVHVMEPFVELLPVRPERPAGAREAEAPGSRARDRQRREAPEGHPREPGRDRHERAHERDDPADHHEGVVEPAEPPFGTLDLRRTGVEQPLMSLDERPAAVAADRPAADRAQDVAEGSRKGDAEVRG